MRGPSVARPKSLGAKAIPRSRLAPLALPQDDRLGRASLRSRSLRMTTRYGTFPACVTDPPFAYLSNQARSLSMRCTLFQEPEIPCGMPAY
jgi:hypothetical protein